MVLLTQQLTDKKLTMVKTKYADVHSVLGKGGMDGKLNQKRKAVGEAETENKDYVMKDIQ